MSGIEKKIEEQNPHFFAPVEKKGSRAGDMTLLASLAHLIQPYGYNYRPRPGRTTGWHRGECRKPKNFSNDPERAPGMRGFPFRDGEWIKESEKDDGPYVIVWAGTLKAAKKKLALLAKNGIEPTHEP